MFRVRRSGAQTSRGFSLIEMLVASAIFAIAAAVAFILYTAAQKSYKAGENFTDQQQATRVAFDRMVSDLRLAGFNTNPDGDKTRVDEQIEGEWDTAVTIRGDFDFEDPVASQAPESSLAGATYNVVSTGNDEIVTYVLAKPGPSGSESLDLWLDADQPRAKTVRKVTIPNVVLTQNNPPYTLYRVTLVGVVGAFPTAPQGASNFVYEPVADNIRSMTFQYFDDAGNKLNPDTPASPGDDIGGADANILARGNVRKITVNVQGMTEAPDMDYTDVTDASATQHYRKFNLSSEVNPANLGKAGVKDLDATPPSTPANVSLVPGHCGGILVKWDQPTSSDGVANYVVRAYPSGSPSALTTQTFPYPHTEYGTVDFLGHAFFSGLATPSTYCFQVQAKDSAGNQSGWGPPSSPPCATVTEASTPGTPQGFAATTGQDSQITLTWNQVKVNAGVVTGDPNTIGGFTIMRDPKGYQLYRDNASAFTGPPVLIADPTNPTLSPLAPTTTQFVDTAVVNCQTYFYRLNTIDTCNALSGYTSIISGRATTTIPPAKPTGLVATRVSSTNVNLTWTPVTTNANGVPESVGLYNIYRAMAPDGTLASTIPSGSYSLRGTSTTASYTDILSGSDKNALNAQPVPNAFYYTVSATDLCPNESARSDAVFIDCQRSSNSFTTTPGDRTTSGVAVNQAVGLSWSGPDPITRVRAHVPNLSGSGDTYDQTLTNSSGLTSPVSFPVWNTQSSGAGVYTILWEAENNHGCVTTWSTTFTVTASLACQITATNPNLSPTRGTPSNRYTQLSWDIQNNSGVDLTINEIDVTWSNTVVSPGPHRLLDIQWPTGTAVSTFSPGALTKVQEFYVFPGPLTFCGSSSGGCTPGPVLNMSMTWDSSVGDGTTSETITVDFFLQDSSGANNKCSLTIVSGP